MNEIPILDLGREDKTHFSQALFRAFSEIGFVALSNHQLEPDLRQRAFAVCERFFRLRPETKARYFDAQGAGARGYTPFAIERARDQSVPDLKEFWHVGRELPPGSSLLPPNRWPTELAEFRSTLLELYRRLEAIGQQVLEALCAPLGLSSGYFADATKVGNSLLRALHYPPLQGDTGGAVRAAAHEDINLITLLVGSEQPGLEIMTHHGQWIPAPGGDDLIICNVGDMLQRLSNHVLTSTTHRVVNPHAPWSERSRYSLPFFLHPNSDFMIESLPTCVSEMRPNRYPEPICADDYLEERLAEIGLKSQM